MAVHLDRVGNEDTQRHASAGERKGCHILRREDCLGEDVHQRQREHGPRRRRTHGQEHHWRDVGSGLCNEGYYPEERGGACDEDRRDTQVDGGAQLGGAQFLLALCIALAAEGHEEERRSQRAGGESHGRDSVWCRCGLAASRGLRSRSFFLPRGTNEWFKGHLLEPLQRFWSHCHGVGVLKDLKGQWLQKRCKPCNGSKGCPLKFVCFTTRSPWDRLHLV